MDFKHINSDFIDSRIYLQTFQTDDGVVETYPLNSFTFEYFLYFELDFKHIYTHTINTPNTYYSEIKETDTYKNFKSINTARVGVSSGFGFYESTLWKETKKQKKQLPLFLLVHTINYFNNVRWVFVAKLNSNKSNSLSGVFPAATWSEREMQDMFDVSFYSLKDTRRLLLEYKTTKGVLNADYTVDKLPKYSLYYDIYYV